MPALLVLLLILLLLGGGGFFWNVLWYALVIAVALWLIGFFVRGTNSRWYYW